MAHSGLLGAALGPCSVSARLSWVLGHVLGGTVSGPPKRPKAFLPK